MVQEKVRVLWNRKVSSSCYKIGLECSRKYLKAKPGQFITLHMPAQSVPFLRRPFSIHRLIKNDDQVEGIELLYKVVGSGTEKLSRYRAGNYVDIVGPLGRGFSVLDNYRRLFIVGGGIGIAPLLFLTLTLNEKGVDLSDSTLFLGGRTKDDVLCKDDFARLKLRVQIITDDGSSGEKGLVTDLLEKGIKEKKPDIICACGPFAMLGAVARIAETYSVPCQISIETIMACGIGACLGCAVESKNKSGKYLHVCMDGPVFDANMLNLK
ncbi:MAG: dihydroorotate dehydrogenase electron transfer subunit [Deltaproteobacteria bacterium]|nr:dihydroorotate dehydrogenase electron transfer subunit [Deltaproteobacteria bacterium]MBW2661663.1 dihydroorotate dehydrogenase electron transfer subunit [Deltaproteobacteria bacterium]